MDFRYEVVRLWEIPIADLLKADVGVLPLAVLGELPQGVGLETGLAAVIQQIIERLLTEAPPEQVRRLLTAAYVLTGLRVSKQLSRELFRGVKAMRESESYMGILEEGAIEHTKQLIVQLGRKMFGVPDESAMATLTAMEDLDHLDRIHERIVEVKNWQELLETE